MKPWPQISLGELCEVTAGGTPSRAVASNFGGDIPWVKIGDMLQGRVVTTEERLSRSGLENSAAKILPAGTVLISIFATIGRTAVLGVNAATNQAIAGITPRNVDVLLPEYLRRFLDSQASSLERRARGVAQANINSSLLRAVPVPLPPLPEQRRIAEILDKANALRAKRRAALVQFDTLTQSIFLDMFGDPATNPKGWPQQTLAGLGAQFRYGTSSKSAAVGKPALRIPNVVAGSIDVSDLKLVPVTDDEFDRLCLRDGDLLFVRTNGNPEFVGRCAVFIGRDVAGSGFPSDQFVFASYLIRARIPSDAILPVFLREFLLSLEGRRQLLARSKTSAGQYNINTESLESVSVTVPEIDHQRAFANRIEVVARARSGHCTALSELNSLFASLQHRAFRGNL
ncbi:MAG: restriction endonuclease subunit S [Woeseiaceae bacterium]